MAFWKENTTLPKRNFRYRVTFGTNDSDAISIAANYWWAKTVVLPKWTSSPVEVDYLDNKYFFPGRVTWEDVTMTMVDPSSPDAVQILATMLAKSGYKVKNVTDKAETVNKIDAANVSMIIEILDEDGKQLEYWTLANAMIISTDLGTLDYSSDDLRELSVTVKYDYAELAILGQTRDGVTSNTYSWPGTSATGAPAVAPPTED